MPTPFSLSRLCLTAAALLSLGACERAGRLDLDLRDNLGGAFDTSPAVEQSVAPRPVPDARGVISYPGYQVAVARRGDTAATIAGRLGLPAADLARYNGLPADVTLRQGEIVALPARVAEPEPGSAPSTPIRSAGLGSGTVTTTTLDARADAAIRRAERATSRTGAEPMRHRVAAGETAFSIARRYGVPVQALGEWNGLGADLAVRDGQVLLIPPGAAEPQREAAVTAPGTGSVAPPPPSAATPLPERDETQAPPEETPASPDLASGATAESAGDARLLFPVTGPIIRVFSKGTNDGIDISASAGTPVKAADGGTVAAITRDTEQVPIVVLRHAGDLLTVYAGVDDVTVEKGDTVQRGAAIATVRDAEPSFLHFEVREGFDSVDPVDYLQ